MFGRNYRLLRPSPIGLSGTLTDPAVSIPVGSVVAWNAASNKKDAKQRKVEVPEDWMLIDGRALNPFKFRKLFFLLGYKYGRKGFKFLLPDWRGHLMTKISPKEKYRNSTGGYLYFYYVMKVK